MGSLEDPQGVAGRRGRGSRKTPRRSGLQAETPGVSESSHVAEGKGRGFLGCIDLSFPHPFVLSLDRRNPNPAGVPGFVSR